MPSLSPNVPTTLLHSSLQQTPEIFKDASKLSPLLKSSLITPQKTFARKKLNFSSVRAPLKTSAGVFTTPEIFKKPFVLSPSFESPEDIVGKQFSKMSNMVSTYVSPGSIVFQVADSPIRCMTEKSSLMDEETDLGVKILPDKNIHEFTLSSLSDCSSEKRDGSHTDISSCTIHDVGMEETQVKISADAVNKERNVTSCKKRGKKLFLPENFIKLKKILKKLKVQNARLKKHKTGHLLSAENILENAARYLSPSAKVLFDAQITLNKCRKYARRWSIEMKNLALSIYFHSPKAYRYLMKLFALPSISTLKRYIKVLPIDPGINVIVKKSLRDQVSTWDKKDLVCCLILDEMSIKEHFKYNPAKDVAVGFVDDGITRKKVVANEVLCAMVKGVTKPWKQVLGFWLTADSENKDTVLLAIQQSVSCLEEIGLTVKLVITDQGPKNRAKASYLQVPLDNPFFKLNGKTIFFMWDTPHLLKSFRNNLLKHDFLYKNQIIKWQYLTDAFNLEHPLKLKLMPKITPEHLSMSNFRKMKVKLAAQIFSSTVATALEVLIALNKLPIEAEATALLFNDMDMLFDSFNCLQLNDNMLKLRFAITPTSRHHSFLKAIELSFQQSKFLGCKGDKQPFCLSGWLLNIRCLSLLVEDLSKNNEIKKIRTRLLNTDGLENMFAIIRQQHGCSDNPTVVQFENGFRSLILTSIPKLSRVSNCEDDLGNLLVSVGCSFICTNNRVKS